MTTNPYDEFDRMMRHLYYPNSIQKMLVNEARSLPCDNAAEMDRITTAHFVARRLINDDNDKEACVRYWQTYLATRNV